MKILQKCGTLVNDEYIARPINSPIRIIYAGKLYMNRWKALMDIVEILREVNKDSVKMVLEIYTKDQLTKKQKVSISLTAMCSQSTTCRETLLPPHPK